MFSRSIRDSFVDVESHCAKHGCNVHPARYILKKQSFESFKCFEQIFMHGPWKTISTPETLTWMKCSPKNLHPGTCWRWPWSYGRVRRTLSQSKISSAPRVPINSETDPGADQVSHNAFLLRKQCNCMCYESSIIIDCDRRFLASLNAPGICFESPSNRYLWCCSVPCGGLPACFFLAFE